MTYKRTYHRCFVVALFIMSNTGSSAQDTAGTPLATEQKRELEASSYVRQWADARALENNLMIQRAAFNAIPIFEDKKYIYYSDSPDLRSDADRALMSAITAYAKIISMGVDAAPALASARFFSDASVAMAARETLDDMGHRAMKPLLRSATDKKSPNRIAAYMELRQRFPLAAVEPVPTKDLLNLMALDSAACQMVIVELGTRLDDSEMIIPVLLRQHEKYKNNFAVQSLCYLQASGKDVFPFIQSGLKRNANIAFTYIDAAASMVTRNELSAADLNRIGDRVRSSQARKAIGTELQQYLKNYQKAEKVPDPKTHAAETHRHLVELRREPVKHVPGNPWGKPAPAFYELVYATPEIRIEVAKAFIPAFEQESTATQYQLLSHLKRLKKEAWPLAPAMQKLVNNRDGSDDGMELAVDAVRILGGIGETEFPGAQGIIDMLATIVQGPTADAVKPPKSKLDAEKYLRYHKYLRTNVIMTLGKLRCTSNDVDQCLRPLLRTDHRPNAERYRAAEAVLNCVGYDNEAIKTLRSLAGGGLLSLFSSRPEGITSTDQEQMRKLIKDYEDKRSGNYVAALIQRLERNPDGENDLRKTISDVGDLGPSAADAIPTLERALNCLPSALRGDAALALAKIDPDNGCLQRHLPGLLVAPEFHVRGSAMKARELLQ